MSILLQFQAIKKMDTLLLILCKTQIDTYIIPYYKYIIR